MGGAGGVGGRFCHAWSCQFKLASNSSVAGPSSAQDVNFAGHASTKVLAESCISANHEVQGWEFLANCYI